MQPFIIGLEITKLSHKIVRALESEIVASVDKTMSATTARIICFVVEQSPTQDIFQKDIEQFLGLNRSSVSLIVSAMEKNDLLTRASVSHDARYKKILPTETAHAYHKKIVQAFDAVEDKMKANLADLSALAATLATIDKNLEE